MDVIEKKYPANKLYPYIQILKYKNDRIDLLGTGGNASQNYPSDIDFFCKITTDEKPEEAYRVLTNIIKESEKRNDMYFIEFKVQDKDGKKIKFTNPNDINLIKFKKYFDDNIDYCKLDYVLYLDNSFIELSIFYVFNKDLLDYDKLKISLSNDLMDLVKEKKYYKSLKRLFAILKLEDPVDRYNLVKISILFNSIIGELYKVNSVLKAIKLLMDSGKVDTMVRRRIVKVFRDIGFTNLSQLDSIISDYDKLINEEGLRFMKTHYPFLLKNYKKEVITLKGQGNTMYRSVVLHQKLIENIHKKRKLKGRGLDDLIDMGGEALGIGEFTPILKSGVNAIGSIANWIEGDQTPTDQEVQQIVNTQVQNKNDAYLKEAQPIFNQQLQATRSNIHKSFSDISGQLDQM
jgi:hypothetical protein